MNNEIFLEGALEKYPEILLENRVNIEANVIGCMVNDMLLAEDTNIDSAKFITKDARLIYGMIKTLRDKKCATFDEVSILTYVPEEIRNQLDERGGFRAVKNMADCINANNYDTYLDDLLKANMILDMHTFGFNLLEPIEYEGKTINPLKLFAKMTSEQVTDWYTAKLEGFGTGYSSKVLEEEELDISDDFIESLESGEEAGTQFDAFDDDCDGNPVEALRYFSNQIGGIPDGFTVIGSYSNLGKTTLILTIIMCMMHYGRKCMIISNEQRSKVFKIGFLLLILTKHFNYYELTKTKLLNGDISDKDMEYIKKAQAYWRERYKGYLRFISIPDSDVGLAIKKMRIGILNYGISTCVYDTFKLDFSSNSDDSTWVSLIRDSRRFESLARKYPGTQVICTLQLAINSLGKLFLDSSVLSMSKQIKEVCDLMILFRQMYPEEFDPSNTYYCRPFKTVYNKATGNWENQDWKPKENRVYRAVFIEKNRSNTTSLDTGIGYIFSFQGQWGIWSDAAKAKFKHGYIQ